MQLKWLVYVIQMLNFMFLKKRYVSILVFYYFMGIFVGSNFP